MRPMLLAIAACGLAFLSGCKSPIWIDLPVLDAESPLHPKGTVYIESVTDQRAFTDKPKDPSQPTFNGGVAKMTPAQQAVLVGRQENQFASPVGDIRLVDNDSVSARVRLLVQKGLKKAGYEVAAEPGEPGGANSASVAIKEFWVSFTMGMWYVSLDATVSCTITIKMPDRVVTMSVKGRGSTPMVRYEDDLYRQAYFEAFQDFETKFAQELTKNGL